ncbi:Mechanosensitive ion channel-domain-containing protein [Haematococcus lacustris]
MMMRKQHHTPLGGAAANGIHCCLPQRQTRVKSAVVHSSQAGSPAPSALAHASPASTPHGSNAHHNAEPAHATSSTVADAASIVPTGGFQLRSTHVLLFGLIFVGGAMFATMTLTFTADMELGAAVLTVLRRVAKSAAFRQLCVISSAILVLRYGMNNFLKVLSQFSVSPVQWDKTRMFYVLREVYQPLELLLFIAALCTVSDAFVPSLLSVPKATVSHVVKSILSTSFILGFASVVFNLKSRWCKENAWQAEVKGDVTLQRRWEAYDKLGTFVIYVMSFVLGIQAIGLEVTSVLAIGGIGGLAIGLAGREICENLLNGFLIMSTNPFEVGDEINFFHNNKMVEGFVIDIGWYRTNLRSFEREVFVIPNAVFSKNIVLNVSRKNREWRFLEVLSLRVQDVHKVNAVVQDMRRIVRNDTRVINKLHRRIFLDKITTEDIKIYMSFYLEAANRDAFMAIKQDLLVSFVDCVEKHQAKLATPRTILDMDTDMADMVNSLTPLMQGSQAPGLPAAPPPNAPATLHIAGFPGPAHALRPPQAMMGPGQGGVSGYPPGGVPAAAPGYHSPAAAVPGSSHLTPAGLHQLNHLTSSMHSNRPLHSPSPEPAAPTAAPIQPATPAAPPAPSQPAVTVGGMPAIATSANTAAATAGAAGAGAAGTGGVGAAGAPLQASVNSLQAAGAGAGPAPLSQTRSMQPSADSSSHPPHNPALQPPGTPSADLPAPKPNSAPAPLPLQPPSPAAASTLSATAAADSPQPLPNPTTGTLPSQLPLPPILRPTGSAPTACRYLSP